MLLSFQQDATTNSMWRVEKCASCQFSSQPMSMAAEDDMAKYALAGSSGGVHTLQ